MLNHSVGPQLGADMLIGTAVDDGRNRGIKLRAESNEEAARLHEFSIFLKANLASRYSKVEFEDPSDDRYPELSIIHVTHTT